MANLDAGTLDRLKHLKVSDPSVGLDHFPTFFIAGPQRTGSTWIHRQISQHPQVFMAEPKELYFFNTIGRPKHRQWKTDDLVDYLKFFEIDSKTRRSRQREAKSRFGENFEPIAIGEGTASYAAGMDAERIRDAIALQPDLKVVIVARDPIERAWSHMKLDLARLQNRSLSDVPDSEIEDKLQSNWFRNCGDYVAIHAKWSQLLPEGNVLLRDFDDIKERPDEVLLDVMRLLGIRADLRYRMEDPDAGKNPTSGRSSDIPAKWRSLMEEVYRPMIAEAQELLGVGRNW